jgi:hypothetical protein
MSQLIWAAAVAGLLCTAVIFGTDVFFLMVGRAALRAASPRAATEVMGFIHQFGDARMPLWGVAAMLANLLLAFLAGAGHRWWYAVSLGMLILFVVAYNLRSKPINRMQTEAAKAGQELENARVLQEAWDRSLLLRVPLLAVAMIAQLQALSPIFAHS